MLIDISIKPRIPEAVLYDSNNWRLVAVLWILPVSNIYRFLV